jgi:hypothetical protein
MTAVDVHKLTDDQLADAYSRQLAAVDEAMEALKALALERFRRAALAAYPQAARVIFERDEYDSGPHLSVRDIVDKDGNVLAGRSIGDHFGLDDLDDMIFMYALTDFLGADTDALDLSPRR